MVKNKNNQSDNSNQKEGMQSGPLLLSGYKIGGSLLGALLVVASTFMVGFYVGEQASRNDLNNSSSSTTTSEVVESSQSDNSSNSYHYQRDGVDIVITIEGNKVKYEGIITTPTPCYSIEVSHIETKSLPALLTIQFITKNDLETEVCIQVIDHKEIIGSIDYVSRDAIFKGISLDGETIPEIKN